MDTVSYLKFWTSKNIVEWTKAVNGLSDNNIIIL